MATAKLEVVEKKATGETPVPPEQAAQALEKELQEFSGGLAYDQARVIERTQDGFRQGVHGFYLAGLGLILLQANEPHTYAVILERYFPGIGLSAAEKYMRFARAASKLPNFKQFCLERGGYSKGLTMLQACTEESLQEFDETGLLTGYTREQIDNMSVLSLKKALRRAREKAAADLRKATGKLSQENAELRDQVHDLSAQVAEGETPADAAVKLIKSATDKVLEGFRLLNKVPRALLVESDIVRDMMFGFIGLGQRVIDNLETATCLTIAEAAAKEEGES